MGAVPAIARFSGAQIARYLDDVARLRIAVFRDWPYLYQGDPGYERDYLAAYAASPDSVFVLAFAGDAVVGASTGLPLADDTAAFHAPFVERGIPVDEVFYCGESVLFPQYRGQGIGHAFFDQREAHARSLGRFAWTAFCSVDRDPDDPRRPPDHRGNEVFWTRRDYQRQPDMTMRLNWREPGIGDAGHTLTFWLRPMEKAV